MGNSINTSFEIYPAKNNKRSNKRNNHLYWELAAATVIASCAALACFHKPTNLRVKSVWNHLFGETSKVETKVTESIQKRASSAPLSSVNTLFNKLKGLKGINFANAVVEHRAEEIGLKGLKFDIIPVKQSERLQMLGDSSAMALCDPDAQKIYILKDILDGKNKKKLLEIIAHEMEHINQSCLVARTEGLGIESMAKAEANRYVAFLQSQTPSQQPEQLMREWERARKLPADAFEQIRAEKYNKYLKELTENNIYQTAIKNKGMIASGTPEAEKAKAYLRELEDILDSVDSSEYANSVSEHDAYAVGYKYARDYESFLNQ